MITGAFVSIRVSLEPNYFTREQAWKGCVHDRSSVRLIPFSWFPLEPLVQGQCLQRRLGFHPYSLLTD